MSQNATPVQPKKLLVLVMSPGRLDFDDFLDVAKEVVKQAPEILVSIVTPSDTYHAVSAHKWQLPTLIISFGDLGRFTPVRGRVFKNSPIAKFVQAERFLQAGIRTPKTAIYQPGLTLDEAEWGHVVVAKPEDLDLSSKGKSASLVPTQKLNNPSLLSETLRKQLGQTAVLIQQYIPTGEYATSYRVGTLFGRVIHMMKKSAPVKAPDLNDPEIEDAIVDSNFEHPDEHLPAARELVMDQEIIAFGVKIAKTFAELPLLGIDILKHAHTGHLYALEINGGGNTWQFSSRHAAPGRLLISKAERIKQFDAWNTCASVLIEKTRYYAR